MPVTLLEKMMLIRLKNTNKHKVCAGLAEVFAKTLKIQAFSLYAGTENSLRLMGVFMDQEEYTKTNPLPHNSKIQNDPDWLEGFNFPLVLSFTSTKKPIDEIKIHGQQFSICAYEFESWKVCVVFGGLNSTTRKKIYTEIQSLMDHLCCILLPMLMLDNQFETGDKDHFEDISQKFIQSMMDLKGFVSFVLRLVLIYFNSDYAGLTFIHQKKHVLIELGEKQNKDFMREFEWLTIGSTKNIFVSSQTQVVIKITLFYLHRIIRRYYKPRIDSSFYLENIMDLTRIYEALFMPFPGSLDIYLDVADFFAKKVDLSEKEKSLLKWFIGTQDMGKVVLRVSSLRHDRGYEEEFHNHLREAILENMSMLIENYEILTTDFSLFSSILKASQIYFNFIHHCYTNDMSQLDYLLAQSALPENFKRMLCGKIIDVKNQRCFEFKSCPEPIRSICNRENSQCRCFDRDSVFGIHFHGKCQVCLFYQLHKEDKI